MSARRFVGREREIERLERFVQLAIDGRGQIAFVAGEAGSGKTALMEAFADHIQERHDDVVVAFGNCNTHVGLGDPYLPFRELLEGLLGLDKDSADSESDQPKGRLRRFFDRSIQVLVEVGPDLIGAIVPGGSLVAKAGAAMVETSRWFDGLGARDAAARPGAIDQTRVFEQYANLLRTLAEDCPIVLVIDDLQWADEASIGLLFHLSRRLGDSRILIVTTYRPDEVARHDLDTRSSLEKLLAEIKRYAGDVTIDLGDTAEEERWSFVNHYVDVEPNRIGAAFRQQVFQRTGGHPLFTVELLRTLQERGHLVRDEDGRWVVDRVDWDTLPARVEGVIEERIGRLNAEERQILDAASVEGTVFTAEVVAKLLELSMRQLLAGLAQRLERQHRLVFERGEVRAGATTLASFQFTHTLFQRYLYRELSSAERRLMHGDIARALQELHGDDSDEFSPQLAWHLDQAREPSLAAEQYTRAGERALIQGAPSDAVRFLRRGMELVQPDDVAVRWRLLKAQVEAFRVLADNDARRRAISEMVEAAALAEDEYRLAEARTAETQLVWDLGDTDGALVAARLAIEHAERSDHLVAHAESLALASAASVRSVDVAAGRVFGEQAFELLAQIDDAAARLTVLTRLWIGYFESGDLGRAVELAEASVALARDINRIRSVPVLSNLGLNQMALGRWDLARRTLEESVEVCAVGGYPRGRGYSLQNLSLVMLHLGEVEAAERIGRESLAVLEGTDDTFGVSGSNMYLGVILERSGRWEEAAAFHLAASEEFERLGVRGVAIEALAGAARCDLALGHKDAALERAERVWSYLDLTGGTSTDNPMRMYLTCVETFAACGREADSARALRAAHDQLAERAARLGDERRGSFLQDVPEHAALLQRWAATV
jgi:tetratricopeptide (TPR) repeat protein